MQARTQARTQAVTPRIVTLLSMLSAGVLGPLLVASCPPPKAVENIASAAPAAMAPDIIAASTRQGTALRCWNGQAGDCYTSVVAASDPRQFTGAFQFELAVRRHWLNALYVFDNEVSAFRGDPYVNPPADATYFAESSFDSIDQPTARSTVFLSPKWYPRSRTHGETSVFRLEERSPNPQYRGASGEKASSSFAITHVEPGKCRILDLVVPSTAANDTNITISWRGVDCKTYVIEHWVYPDCSMVQPGYQPERITVGPLAGIGGNYSDERTFRTIRNHRGRETFKVTAQDAVGRSSNDRPSRDITVTGPGCGSSGSGGQSGSTGGSGGASGCASPFPVTVCTSCPPPSSDYLSIESQSTVSACNIDEAVARVKSQQQVSCPSVTAVHAELKSYPFCVQCGTGQISARWEVGCTEATARTRLQTRLAVTGGCNIVPMPASGQCSGS